MSHRSNTRLSPKRVLSRSGCFCVFALAISNNQLGMVSSGIRTSSHSKTGSEQPILYVRIIRCALRPCRVFTGQTKELRFSFFFFSLLYIGAGPVWVVSGGAGPVWVVSGGRAGGRVKAEWPVGWPVANVSNGSCPKSTSINIRRFQTSN